MLMPINKRTGDLMKYVVEVVLPDLPTLVPTDVIDTLRELLVHEGN